MKTILLLISFLASVHASAHEIEATVFRRGDPMPIPRSPIPFDGFSRQGDGRLYTLWIAPDGALVFYLEKPWDNPAFSLNGVDPRFRVWMVEARRQLELPSGFEERANDEKGQIDGVEEMVGNVEVTWRGDSDYLISMDVKGVKKQYALSGCLLGGSKNRCVAKKKAAEPGATDNPDDAQRFREDD